MPHQDTVVRSTSSRSLVQPLVPLRRYDHGGRGTSLHKECFKTSRPLATVGLEIRKGVHRGSWTPDSLSSHVSTHVTIFSRPSQVGGTSFPSSFSKPWGASGNRMPCASHVTRVLLSAGRDPIRRNPCIKPVSHVGWRRGSQLGRACNSADLITDELYTRLWEEEIVQPQNRRFTNLRHPHFSMTSSFSWAGIALATQVRDPDGKWSPHKSSDAAAPTKTKRRGNRKQR